MINEPLQNYDRLHRKTSPGFSFSQAERELKFMASPEYKSDAKLQYHFASGTEKVYSPFQSSYYNPPHLNSSKS